MVFQIRHQTTGSIRVALRLDLDPPSVVIIVNWYRSLACAWGPRNRTVVRAVVRNRGTGMCAFALDRMKSGNCRFDCDNAVLLCDVAGTDVKPARWVNCSDVCDG